MNHTPRDSDYTSVFDSTGLFILKHGSSRKKNFLRVAYKKDDFQIENHKLCHTIPAPWSSALSPLQWPLSLESVFSNTLEKSYFHQNVQHRQRLGENC